LDSRRINSKCVDASDTSLLPGLDKILIEAADFAEKEYKAYDRASLYRAYAKYDDTTKFNFLTIVEIPNTAPYFLIDKSKDPYKRYPATSCCWQTNHIWK